jgi:hypothetical protein
MGIVLLYFTLLTRGSIFGNKALGREAEHSPVTNAGVKKIWIYTSTPPYIFIM